MTFLDNPGSFQRNVFPVALLAGHEEIQSQDAPMRCYQDLREFLTVLEQQGQLLRISDEVRFEPDLAAAGCALAQIGDGVPAILFDRIAGCTDARVVMNVHGSWPNHALALGMDKETSLRELLSPG